MKSIFTSARLILLVLLFQCFSHSTALANDDETSPHSSVAIEPTNTENKNRSTWELVKKSHGITLYFRDYPNSNIPEFRAITIVDSSMASIIALLLDSSACSLWVHQCKESQTITVVNSREQYVYQLNQIPLVRDRDIILHAALDYALDGKEVTINITATPDFCNTSTLPFCTYIKASRYVHIEDAVGSYRLKEISPNKVEVIWQQYVDPAGFLPSWLAKSQLIDLPIKTLHSLKKVVMQEKYQQTNLVIDDSGLHIIQPEPDKTLSH